MTNRIIVICCILIFSCCKKQTSLKSPLQTPLEPKVQIIEINEFVDIVKPDLKCPDSTHVLVQNLTKGLKIEAYLSESNLQAKFTQPDTTIYLDPCFEVFIDPGADGLAYYEFEINAIGSAWPLKLKTSKGRINDPSNILKWNIPSVNYFTSARGTVNDSSDIDEFWKVELTIPWTKFSEARPKKGDKWAFNFMRIDYDSNETASYWVWKPTGKKFIHIPEKWPVIEF